MSIKRVLLFLLLILFIVSCKDRYLIDNPTNSNIKVYIDNKEYNIGAKKYLRVKLIRGKHRISSEKDGIKILENENFIIPNQTEAQDALINPTKSQYIIYPLLYSKDSNIKREFKAYDLEGNEVLSYYGKPVLTDNLFIFDLFGKGNIDKEVKEYSSSVIQNKIFRKEDFFEFYNKKLK